MFIPPLVFHMFLAHFWLDAEMPFCSLVLVHSSYNRVEPLAFNYTGSFSALAASVALSKYFEKRCHTETDVKLLGLSNKR